MEQNILKEWIVRFGKKHSMHRIDVMISALEKAKETTNNSTGSDVVDDVINLLNRINKDIEQNLF